MKNKKTLLFTLCGALMLSSACSVQENAQVSETTTTVPETAVISEETVTAVSEQTAAVTPETQTESTSAPEKTETEEKAVYIDKNGFISETGVKRYEEIFAENSAGTILMYAGFFDFDLDGVPELYIVYHNSGQGYMPVKVFSTDGEELGEFYGYSRDGYTRFSYGDGCVYVHNKEEHSMHRRNETVSKITVENGRLVTEQILCAEGAVGNRFPLMEMSYFVNGEATDADSYYNAYSPSREANEVSLCAYDIDKSSDVQAAVDIYNAYVSGINAVRERFGCEPTVFAFDDYDGKHDYEAFVKPENTDSLYFWNGTDFKETGNEYPGWDFTRQGGLFYSQPLGNSLKCDIYGVRGGSFYKHEYSGYTMLIRRSELFPLNFDINGNFVLYSSKFDSTSPGGSHTFKPYFFEYSCKEIVGVPVTEADFADRTDILEELDKLKAILAENEGKAGEITGMYLRGERYLNVNYIEPIETQSEDGTVNYIAARNRYKTYLIQNQVTLIDEGRGVYTSSVKG